MNDLAPRGNCPMLVNLLEEVRDRDNTIPVSTTASAGESFGQAQWHARLGRFPQARAALAVALAEGNCTQAQAFDLDARMYAQQGMIFDADACWRKAQT